MEKYQLQLEQVEASLAKDPQNGTLQLLKSKLEQLLALTQSTTATGSTTSNSTTTKTTTTTTTQPPLQVGEECEVFFKEQGTWQAARILSFLPAENVYIVEMIADKTTRRLAGKQVRRPRDREAAKPKKKPPHQPAALVHKPTGKKRPPKKEQPELAGAVEWKKFSQRLKK